MAKLKSGGVETARICQVARPLASVRILCKAVAFQGTVSRKVCTSSNAQSLGQPANEYMKEPSLPKAIRRASSSTLETLRPYVARVRVRSWPTTIPLHWVYFSTSAKASRCEEASVD
eukprot:6490793-Amphidinium_carterae.4